MLIWWAAKEKEWYNFVHAHSSKYISNLIRDVAHAAHDSHQGWMLCIACYRLLADCTPKWHWLYFTPHIGKTDQIEHYARNDLDCTVVCEWESMCARETADFYINRVEEMSCVRPFHGKNLLHFVGVYTSSADWMST